MRWAIDVRTGVIGIYFDPHEHMQGQLQQFKTLVKQLQDGEDASVAAYF